MRLATAPGRGFPEPVRDAQASFRAVLAALSEPGTVHDLGTLAEAPGLAPASAALLLALADGGTPVWLDPARRDGPAGAWVRFHPGAPLADDPARAVFAVLDGAAPAPRLDAFPAGEEAYPDRSATLLVEIAALDGGPPLRLTGPGVRGARVIAPAGLRAGFAAELAANGALFPLGVDVILVAGSRVLGLPRSVRVEEAD